MRLKNWYGLSFDPSLLDFEFMFGVQKRSPRLRMNVKVGSRRVPFHARLDSSVAI